MNPGLSWLFPLLALSASVIAYFHGNCFSAMKNAVVPLLALIMFCMGLTLSWSDFRRVFERPKPIWIGVGLQFLLMPAFALAISLAFRLPKELSTGMILVGCVSGGTASNVICCLAGARVALSISMTAVSTILGLFLTPILTWIYAGHFVSVPLGGMLYNISLMVIIPVAIGVALNRPLTCRREQLQRYCPLVSMLAIVMVIAIVVAMNRAVIAEAGLTVFMAVAAHNLCGMVAGYLLARLCGCDIITARTVSIEVGMQNSGLAAALAKSCFTPAAALPGAIFSIWHNLSGSLAAAYWKYNNTSDTEPIVESSIQTGE